VAAREDQPQPIVDDRAVVAHGWPRVQAHQLRQPLRAVGHRPVAAQAVDRPPPGRCGDPRARVGRHAVAPPDRHGRLERVLDRILGQLEITDLTDQRGQHDCALLAERLRDGGGYGVWRRTGAAHAGCNLS
jgi:hypothetical protein